MPFTTKYEFEEIAYGTTGWNAIVTDNFDEVDAYLNTYLRYPTASGEVIAEGDALCIHNEHFKQAKADGILQPAVGFAIEESTSGEYVRAKRCGQVTNTGWNLSGSGEIWLHPTTLGGITQTEPVSNAQRLGAAIATTKIIVQL
ncbi:MAG: hypothetical protein KKC50_08090 [Candidatus Omnitrophica bacterium]|nr:hypothetical protein [Candidatus Omnitrophota bacterium]